MSDPYINPEFGILRNKFGLTNQESLDRAEANAVSARSSLLQLNPLRGVGHGAAQYAAHTRFTSTSVSVLWLLLPVSSTFREKRCFLGQKRRFMRL